MSTKFWEKIKKFFENIFEKCLTMEDFCGIIAARKDLKRAARHLWKNDKSRLLKDARLSGGIMSEWHPPHDSNMAQQLIKLLTSQSSKGIFAAAVLFITLPPPYGLTVYRLALFPSPYAYLLAVAPHF